MKEVNGYNPSKDPRLIDCKTECGNGKCYARRYGLFAEKTCQNFVEPKPITNADRLRSMSDEELAEMFNTMNGIDRCCPNNGAHNCRESCMECWLDWLKQEVKE